MVTQLAEPVKSAGKNTASDVVIETRSLTKIYRDFWGRQKVRALSALDLQIKQGEKDAIKDGITVGSADEANVVVTLGSSAGLVEGTVIDSSGGKVPAALIALVPDAPLRGAFYLYRTTTSDQNGTFSIRAVAPGTYRLFAWTEVDGAAYKNAEFLKKYDDKGTAVKVDRSTKATAPLTLLQ